jgi:hypothetical protein
MPSTLFNVLFLAALFVPAAMYLLGLLCLLTSLVVKHRRETVGRAHTVEALAH